MSGAAARLPCDRPSRPVSSRSDGPTGRPISSGTKPMASGLGRDRSVASRRVRVGRSGTRHGTTRPTYWDHLLPTVHPPSVLRGVDVRRPVVVRLAGSDGHREPLHRPAERHSQCANRAADYCGRTVRSAADRIRSDPDVACRGAVQSGREPGGMRRHSGSRSSGGQFSSEPGSRPPCVSASASQSGAATVVAPTPVTV